MSKELKEILQEILQELKEIRQESKKTRKIADRFDEFILELAPSEAREEISDLEQ